MVFHLASLRVKGFQLVNSIPSELLNNLLTRLGNNHEWLEKVLIEVRLLQTLSHANLVSYRHVWLEDTKITGMFPPRLCPSCTNRLF
jgi:hypothetical protein